MNLSSPPTSGPWSLESDGSLVMQREVISSTLGPDWSSIGEKRANTRLISAAPDLLHAARMVLSAMGADQVIAAEEACEVAIAKAEGKEAV